MIKLKRIKLKNYKIHRDFETAFEDNFFELKKPNEYGKSTIFEAISDAFAFCVDKIKDKGTKGRDKPPVIILEFRLNSIPYTLSLNAQSDKILLEGEDGTYLTSERSIKNFFEEQGYRMFPFVVSNLLHVREKDMRIDTDSSEMEKFAGDIFNVKNINTIIKIISDKFLSKREPGLKKEGFGSELEETKENIDVLKNEIEELEKKLKEYEGDKKKLEKLKKEKEKLDKEIDEKERKLLNIKILKDAKKKEELEEEKGKIGKELDETREKYNTLLARKKELNAKLEGLTKKQEGLEKRIEENNKRLGKIKDLEHEKKVIAAKIERAEKLKNELNEKEKEKNRLENEVKELEVKKKVLEGKKKIIEDVLDLYDEIEKTNNLLKEIKVKQEELQKANNEQKKLSEQKQRLEVTLDSINKETKKLRDELDNIKIEESSDVLKERLLRIEKDIKEIEESLDEVKKLKEEIEDINKNAYPWGDFTQSELKDAYLRWKLLLEQKSTGTIDILEGKVFIDGIPKNEGDTYNFENEALIESENLKLKIYASSLSKENREKIEKYIEHFKNIDNLKESIDVLERIKEIEDKIRAKNPNGQEERLQELKEEQTNLREKIEEVAQKEERRKKLEKKIKELEKEGIRVVADLNALNPQIDSVRKKINEVESELKKYEGSDKLESEVKEKEGLIKSKLESIGYDGNLSYDDVKNIQSNNKNELNKGEKKLTEENTDLKNIKKRIEEIENEIKDIKVEEAKERLEEIEREIDELKKSLEDVGELKRELDSVKGEMNRINEELKNLLKEEGTLKEKIKNLNNNIKKLEDEINGIKVEDKLDSIPYGIIKKYDNMSSCEIEKEIQEIEKNLKELRDKFGKISEEVARLDEKVKNIPDREELERKRNKLLENERKLESIERMKEILVITKDVLTEVREDIEKEYLIKMQERTKELFSEITNGRYRFATFNSDTFLVKDGFEQRWYVEDENGYTYSFRELSDGTKIQLALSIRLALISLFLGKNRAFLMLDEPFAYFDPKREENARRILEHLSEQNWQILLASAKVQSHSPF